jgi:hypothetical protein
MSNEYINIDNVLVPVNREDVDDINMLKIGEAYIDEDESVYVFRGDYQENVSDNIPGMYINSDGELLIVEYPLNQKKTVKNIINKKLSKKEEIFNMANKISQIEKTKSKTKPKKTESNNEEKGRNSSQVLIFDIADENDDLVRLIKETANERGLTYSDIYDKCDSNNAGYNLIYGLRTRHTMSFESARKWANILDMELNITLVEKK